MLIETIKNHPCGWREETLKMATLPGHTVDTPDVRARFPECRLINSRFMATTISWYLLSLFLCLLLRLTRISYRICHLPFPINFSKIRSKTIDFTRLESRNIWTRRNEGIETTLNGGIVERN